MFALVGRHSQHSWFCLSGFTAMQVATELQQTRAGSAMDGTIDSTTTKQTLVGGIDDSINSKRYNI